jgi:hypothetical protein
MRLLDFGDWGVKNALGLMARHWWAVGLASVVSIPLGFMGPPPSSESEGVREVMLQLATRAPVELAASCLSALGVVAVVYLSIRHHDGPRDRRVLIHGSLAAVAISGIIWALGIALEITLAGLDTVTGTAAVIIWFASILPLIAMVVVYVGSFCVVPQIIVDGRLNLARAISAIERRTLRLLVLVMLSSIPMFVLSPFFANAMGTEAFQGVTGFWIGLQASFLAALGVVWFYNPAVRTPEDSTTWVVPSSKPG